MGLISSIQDVKPLTVLKRSLAWYCPRLATLAFVERGAPHGYQEVTLDRDSADAIAKAIDVGIGRKLVTAGDGSMNFSSQSFRHDRSSDKTLEKAWL